MSWEPRRRQREAVSSVALCVIREDEDGDSATGLRSVEGNSEEFSAKGEQRNGMTVKRCL